LCGSVAARNTIYRPNFRKDFFGYAIDSLKVGFILKLMKKEERDRISRAFYMAFFHIYELEDQCKALEVRVKELEDLARKIQFSLVGDN